MTLTNPPTNLPPAPRRKWRSWIFALVIFLGGAFCGAGITTVAILRTVHHAIQHPEEAPTRITNRLKHKLDLTDDQTARVHGIIASHQKSLMTIRRDIQPRIEKELLDLEGEIATVLSPQQQEKWHGMLTNIRQNWLPPAPTTLPAE